jgi:hypothetical protein
MQQQTIIWSAGVALGDGVGADAGTHYPLPLVVYTANVPARTGAPEGMRWVPIAMLRDEALPECHAQGDRAWLEE